MCIFVTNKSWGQILEWASIPAPTNYEAKPLCASNYVWCTFSIEDYLKAGPFESEVNPERWLRGDGLVIKRRISWISWNAL